jgi:thiosulfate/3-mercaptopyruvate sulfurtransferase
MFGNHCNTCHTSCGDCHVSQPTSVGGGFIDGHNYNATPSMTRNCTACHGSRVGNEYLGKHEDLKADVHFRQGRMTCVDCHSSHELHGRPPECEKCHTSPEDGAAPPPNHRYDGPQSPRCETCHITAATGQDEIEMHNAHGGDLSCQVCHSLSYTSCDGCHVAQSETTGNPFFSTDGSYLTFLIGRNPIPSFDRPYEYVPLRHVPIARDSFSFYGDALLPNFDSLPTWAYATPHNIQLDTPQAESCDACHGNPDLFLTADKVAEDELEANRSVIVDTIPAPIAGRSLEVAAPISPTLTITNTIMITNTQTITGTDKSP